MDIKERARIIVANGGWGDGKLLNFAEDVCEALNKAYMPVPRCDGCENWTPHPPDAYPGGASGWCRVLMFTSPVGERQYTTSADFGCVRWEAKL